MKWEYGFLEAELTIGSALQDSKERMNKLGEEGWELVAIPNETRDEDLRVLVFKRPKDSDFRGEREPRRLP